MTTATAAKWEINISKWTPVGGADRGERAWLWIRDEHGRDVVDTESFDVYPLKEKHRAMIEAIPQLLAACMLIGNVRDDGRCCSCNCEIEPEHFYCGCEPREDELQHNLITARAAVAAALRLNKSAAAAH
jgi:hypothetical protein